MLISTSKELKENIKTIEEYLANKKGDSRQIILDYIKRGKVFVAYKINNSFHFAPSRFIGYKNNSIEKHARNKNKDGKDTNSIIDSILGRHEINDKLESEYVKYCIELGIEIYNNKRTYWVLNQ